ncbi:MAG: hypoxanthine-guanine phosphoribosyltransferase [Methylococcales bacterium]|nr:MAG: hypoxanthine-guanine phosphoribosyltransferase [Methylococcales bacterium]
MLKEINAILADADLLVNEQQIAVAITQIAEKINSVLADRNLLVLCVMNGGLVFTGQLLPQLTIALTLDSINASRYHNQTSGGAIEWVNTPRTSIKGRTILIVDDILDEGITLAAIYEHCLAHGAASIYSAVLVNKLLGHSKAIFADFIGLNLENRYLFGYGMDYKGYLRNAPGIYACKEHHEE